MHSTPSIPHTLSPKQAWDKVLKRQTRNDRRLLVSCALAGAAVLGPGLAGALFDAWPAIVAGFALACLVLGLEWARWRRREKALGREETQALFAWIQAQDDPFQEARRLEAGHYGPVIARVGRRWIKERLAEQEMDRPTPFPQGKTKPAIPAGPAHWAG